LGATVLGAGAALEFDRLIAIGRWLTLPVGQEALLNAVVTAGLTGFLVWVACVLTVRTISGVALRPYHRLADRLERLVDGDVDDLADLHGPVVGVRRLARTIFVFQERLLESRRAEADLQRRYDTLYQAHAEEHQRLLDMLVGRAPGAERAPSPPQEPEASTDFDMPAPPGDAMVFARPDRAAALDLLGPLHAAVPPMPTTAPVQLQRSDPGRIDIAFTTH
jgi:hypothetical protein